jgi:hypothetical protein
MREREREDNSGSEIVVLRCYIYSDFISLIMAKFQYFCNLIIRKITKDLVTLEFIIIINFPIFWKKV